MTMNKTRLILSTLMVSATVCGSASAQDEMVVYENRFVNVTGANAPFQTHIPGEAWQDYYSETAVPDKDPTTGHYQADFTGNPGVELTFDDNDLGAIFFYTFSAGPDDVLALTEDVDIDMTGKKLSKITLWVDASDPYRAEGDNMTVTVHMLVKVGGQYYVTAQGFPYPKGGERIYEQVTFDASPDAGNWINLNFTPESVMELGEVLDAPLPSGNIEAIGFYNVTEMSSANKNFAYLVDDVMVYAVEDDGGGDPVWYGYDVDAEGWANTLDWMGWVNVSSDPWISVLNLDGRYVYIPDSTGWAYVPK